jgi:hypothetical protein
MVVARVLVRGMIGGKVGVRGGMERGGGLGLTLPGGCDALVIALAQQGKPKAPAPLHPSPYPYSPTFLLLNETALGRGYKPVLFTKKENILCNIRTWDELACLSVVYALAR